MTRPETTVSDYDDERRKQRLHETRTGHSLDERGIVVRTAGRIALSGLAVGAAASVVGAQYWVHDVLPERERLAQTQPEIHEIYHATDPANTTAVVDLVGLGNLDASQTASSLPSLAEIGDVWAVQYDNSGIDTTVIAQIVEEKAEANNIDSIAIVGHSMGGIIGLEVANYIYEETDLDLMAVVLDCTPINLDAVRPEERSRGQEMMRWMGWIPGARESRSLRTVVEVGARKDRFLTADSSLVPSVDFGALADVVDEVLREKIFNEGVASNGLIEMQFAAIATSGARDNLRALAQIKDGKILPVIVFMRPTDASADQVVDNDYTQSHLLESRVENETALMVARMDTGHANPNQEPQKYDAAIEAKVVPFTQKHSESPVSDDTDKLAEGN
ncbi:MAG: alpha/beta hydrolase [Chloroflexi bacterium]|nr:MAG: alpha/beta hydrolase [Chloroflexota bacterium]